MQAIICLFRVSAMQQLLQLVMSAASVRFLLDTGII